MTKYSNFISLKVTCVSEAMTNNFHFSLWFLSQISSNFRYVFFKQLVFNYSELLVFFLNIRKVKLNFNQIWHLTLLIQDCIEDSKIDFQI